MIAVLYGKDDFSAHEALAALSAELSGGGVDQDGLADNTVRVDGRSAKPEELLAICQTMPFLAALAPRLMDLASSTISMSRST